jgi:hypothetical protein
MTIYLATLPDPNIFSLLEAQVRIATQEKIDEYATKGHAMVLKCIFRYDGKDWAFFKNSWGIEVGFNGHHIAPIGALLDCRIYIPKIREYIYINNVVEIVFECVINRIPSDISNGSSICK